MSDSFYRAVRFVGGFGFWSSGSPTIVGMENVPPTGACILAVTHQSYFDVPLVMWHTPRLMDTVSIVEEMRKPLVGWFYRSMNAFPLDRSRADPKTVRVILERLQRGRTILLFPEGGIRTGDESVVNGGRIRPGIGRIARLAQAPIIPVVLVNSGAYARFTSWLPLRRIRYGLSYGAPIAPSQTPEALESALVQSLRAQDSHLRALMRGGGKSGSAG